MRVLHAGVLFCVTVIISSCLLTPNPVKADAVTDTISIHIGYFGWEDEQYIEKSTYHWRELDDMFGGALATQELVYSYFSGTRTYLAAARGFYVKDLLELAGIDFNSISKIDFFTKDQTVGAYRSFTKASLFDMPRYYFPNLAAREDTGEQYAYDGGDIYGGAVIVEPMLALEDYTEWGAVGYEFERLYNNTMFSATNRFHLFFGQLSPEEANTSSAAKYVHKIFITFSGTPILSTEETNIELKVGSDFRMTINVSAEDSLLNEYVQDNLVWSSNNESIVEVDNFGNLLVKSEGTAEITASFGESSVSAFVNVGGEESAEGGEGLHSDAEAAQTDTSDILQEGNDPDLQQPEEITVPEPEEAENESAEEMPENEITEAPEQEQTSVEVAEQENIVQFAENNKGMYILSSEAMSTKENADWVNSILQHKYIDNDSNGALNNARKQKMDTDAEQLIVLDKNDKGKMSGIMGALTFFFFSGFGYGTVSFRKKMQ